MKKLTTLLVLGLIAACSACSSGLNDALPKDEDAPPAEQAVVDKSAAYRYLGVMYTSDTGKALEDEALKGDMYTLYKDKIQKALNLFLHFPIKTQSERAADTGGSGTEWYKANWYDSTPSEIRGMCAGTGDDALAKAMAAYLLSKQGQADFQEYITKTAHASQELITYANSASAPEFQPDTNRILESLNILVASGESAAIVPHYNGSFFASALSLANTGMSVYGTNQAAPEFQAISDQFAIIQNNFSELQHSLRTVNNTLDKNVGITLPEVSDYCTDAEYKLEAIGNMLYALRNVPQKRREYIDRLINTTTEYEEMMVKAFHAMQSHADTVDAVATLENCKVPVKIAFTTSFSSGTYTYISDEINLKNPALMTTFLLEDINLLKRLSLTRLSLAEEVYSDNDLLRYRSLTAQLDLNRLNGIKKKVDSKAIIDELNNILNSENILFTAIISGHTYKYPLISGFFNGTIPLDYGDAPDKRYYIELIIYVNNEQVYNYRETDANPGNGVWEPIISGNISSREEFLNKLQEIGKVQIYDKAYNNYFVTVLSSLAEWEIQLRAHIAAAEGLE